MTYLDHEYSEYEGYPTELYRFQNGDNFWNYTSADHAITLSSVVYAAGYYVKRTGIKISPDANKNILNIEVSYNNPVASLFLNSVPLLNTSLTIRRIHEGDSEAVIIWQGEVTSVSWPKKTLAVLRCEPLSAVLKLQAAKYRFQNRCNHTVYDGNCGASFETFKHTFTSTVLSDNGLTITLPGISTSVGDPPTYYKGGLLKYSTNIYGMVEKVVGDDVTTIRRLPAELAGKTIYVAPGCQNLRATCIDVFNNFDNYFGCPDVPNKNIFQGDGLKGSV